MMLGIQLSSGGGLAGHPIIIMPNSIRSSSSSSSLDELGITTHPTTPADHIKVKLSAQMHRYFNDNMIRIERVGIDPEAGGMITDIHATINVSSKAYPFTIIHRHPSFLVYLTANNDDDDENSVQVKAWIESLCNFGTSGDCHTLSALLQYAHKVWYDDDDKGQEYDGKPSCMMAAASGSSTLGADNDNDDVLSSEEIMVSSVAKHLERARSLHKGGHHAQALDALLTVLHLHPSHDDQALQEYFTHLFDEAAATATTTASTTTMVTSSSSSSTRRVVMTPPLTSSSSSSSSSSYHAATAPVPRTATTTTTMSKRVRSSSSVMTGGQHSRRDDRGPECSLEERVASSSSTTVDSMVPPPPDSTTTASQWSSRSTTPTSGSCIDDDEHDDDDQGDIIGSTLYSFDESI